MPDIENARDPVDLFVGRRLRTFRKARRLSLEELGSSVGLTYQQIQKYENGANRISASTLWKLSKVLGVGVSMFFPDFDRDTDPETAAIMAGLQRLDPEIRKIVVALIDAVVTASTTG